MRAGFATLAAGGYRCQYSVFPRLANQHTAPGVLADRERREASLVYVRKMVTSIAILESVFVSLLGHLAFLANRNAQPLNNALFMTILLGFMGATLVLVVQLVRRFSLPKNAPSAL